MILAEIMNRLFDWLTAPLAGAPAWAMVFLSVLTAVWALLLFRRATDQRRLVAARRVLLGHVYELGLYQERLGGLFRIQWDLLGANLRYLAASLPAVAVLLVPMVLTVVQLDARFAHRPFRPQETAVVTATLESDRLELLNTLRLTAPDGVLVETRPVRDRREGSVAWRVRIEHPGQYELVVNDEDGGRWSKDLVAEAGLPALAAVREKPGWHHAFFNPAEKPLDRDAPVANLSLQLPVRETRYLGVGLSWLVAFCIFSLAAGLALHRVLRVKF